MKSYTISYILFPILLVAFLVESVGAAEGEKDGVYIVYMGAATGSSKNDHAQILSSVLKR